MKNKEIISIGLCIILLSLLFSFKPNFFKYEENHKEELKDNNEIRPQPKPIPKPVPKPKPIPKPKPVPQPKPEIEYDPMEHFKNIEVEYLPSKYNKKEFENKFNNTYKKLNIPSNVNLKVGINLIKHDEKIIYTMEGEGQVIVKNKKAYFIINDKEIEIPINNVKDISIHGNPCDITKEYMYVTTYDNNIFYQDLNDDFYFENFNIAYETLNNMKNNFLKANLNYVFEDIYLFDNTKRNLNYLGCANIELVAKATDGKLYYLTQHSEKNAVNLNKETEKEYNNYSQYYYINYDSNIINYVNMDGDIIIIDNYNNKSFNTKIKFKFQIGKYIFDTDNNAYITNYDYDKKIFELKKLGIVDSIYSNNVEVLIHLTNNNVIIEKPSTLKDKVILLNISE